MQSISDSTAAEPVKSKDLRERPFYAGVLFFIAVFLPVLSFWIEIVSGWCAETFFDPMPTWWHVLLVAFVPITNLQTWFAVRNKRTERLAWLGFANALVLFISIFYAVVYAPLLPLAVFALILFFLGLLPMTPLLALIGTILLRRELHKLQPATENKPRSFGLRYAGIGAAFAAILLILSVAEVPFTLTRIGLSQAASENQQIQTEGLQFLRRWGNDDYVLRNCYSNSGKITTDMVGELLAGRTLEFVFENENSFKAVSPEKVREIYYRLHGKQYNQVPAPRGAKSWEREDFADLSDEPEAANRRLLQGLSLASSQMDGSIDGDAALSYLEWTLTFKNEKSWQQEAVANIQLPPDAVVSRLTLWINNEEREAAFAGRERVTEAYNAVTARRRDPVLVTTAGKDRIAVRAFPVPPNGEMKVRIGFTAPLHLADDAHGLLLLPHFNERNFAVAAEHSIWLESKNPIEATNPAFRLEAKENLFAVRGKLRNEDLSRTGSPVRAAKSPEIKTAWTRFAADSDKIVKQEIVQSAEAKFSNLIFVVDANQKMQEFQSEIAKAIRALPAETPVSLVLTGGNGLNPETAAPNSLRGTPQQIAARIESAVFDGGTDGTTALETAYDLIDREPDSAIVWLHSPQSIKLDSADRLKQRFVRRPSSALVYSLQTRNGANTIEKELDGFAKVRVVPRFADFKTDLSSFLSEIAQQFADQTTAVKTKFTAVRTIENAANAKQFVNAKQTSDHLVRLWASEEVGRLLQNNQDKAALELAVKHQLVTPVSGAVVLETKEQYEQFGLKPVEPGSVPTIPEPEEYLLFAIVFAVLTWLAWRSKKRRLIES